MELIYHLFLLALVFFVLYFLNQIISIARSLIFNKRDVKWIDERIYRINIDLKEEHLKIVKASDISYAFFNFRNNKYVYPIFSTDMRDILTRIWKDRTICKALRSCANLNNIEEIQNV